MIPFELYAQLLPVIEDLEIAQLVRERGAAGESVPLADVAAAVGLDPADYRAPDCTPDSVRPNGQPGIGLCDIVGSWLLESAVVVTTGGALSHPYGVTPQGVLLYTADGWMSVTIPSVGDGPTPGAIFYAGTVTIEDTIVTHHVLVGTDPFPAGTDQQRQVELNQGRDTLTLTTPTGLVVETTIRLTWKRAEPPTEAAGHPSVSQ